MESNLEETNSTSSVNSNEKVKKSFSASLMDASIIVLIFTGLTYLLGMKYKEGYLGYYKITDVMLSDVGMDYIINSFTNILVLLIFWGIIYIVFLPFLSAAKRTTKVFRIIMIAAAIYTAYLAMRVLVFNDIVDETVGSLLGWACAIFLIFDVAVAYVKEQIHKGKYSWLRNVLNKLNPAIWEVQLIIFDIKKNRYLKFVFLIPVIYFAILVFFHLGETEAQRKDEYLIIKYEEKVKDKKTGKEKVKETDFVVITESKNNLLIAPVDLDEKAITPTYSIIEAKSKFNKLVKLEAMKFNGGLKIDPIKTK